MLASPIPRPALLSWRTILGLSASVFVLATVAALPGLSAGGVALGGLSSVANVPANLIVASLGLALFAGPLLFGRGVLKNASWPGVLGYAALAGAWLGVGTLFVLSLAARVVPVEDSGVPVGALTCALLALISIVSNAAWERGALSLLLGWVVLLPTATYFVTDVFLSGPAGGTPLVELQTPAARALCEWNHLVLQYSPGTLAFGALNGRLLDESPCSSVGGLLGLLAVALFATGFLAWRRGIKTGATAPASAP